MYRTAYASRLLDTLRTHYPTTAEVLEHRFDAVATAYLAHHPSTTPSLRDFGRSFPGFLRDALGEAGPATEELATFERILRDSFDAPDAPAVGLSALQELATEALPDLRLTLHPSTTVFESRWGVVEAWNAVATGQTTHAAVEGPTVAWLVHRAPDRLTRFRSLRPLAHVLVSALAAGRTFAEACDAALEVGPSEQVPLLASAELRQLLEDGVVTQLRT